MTKWRDLNGGQRIKRATTWSVLIVAVFAAVVSYSHIRDLALTNGYDTLTSYLLPLSVDGLIVGTSFMLLTAGREHLRASVARCGLWLGIGATLAANVAYGLPHGVSGALTSAWPAVAFIVIVEAWMQLQKKKPAKHAEAGPTQRHADKPKPPKSTVNKQKTSRGGHAAGSRTVSELPPPPHTVSIVNGTAPEPGEVPTPYRIAKELKCGHAKSVELHNIMKQDGVSLKQAIKIREDRKKVKNGTSNATSLRVPAVPLS